MRSESIHLGQVASHPALPSQPIGQAKRTRPISTGHDHGVKGAKGYQSARQGTSVKSARDSSQLAEGYPPRSWKEAIASCCRPRALPSEDFGQVWQPSVLGRPIRAKTGAEQSKGTLRYYGPRLPQALSHFPPSPHYAALPEATDIRKTSPLSRTAQGRGLIV